LIVEILLHHLGRSNENLSNFALCNVVVVIVDEPEFDPRGGFSCRFE
jgi:hypothetical protein